MLRRIPRVWFDLAAILLALVVIDAPSRALTKRFFLEQDAPILAAILGSMAAARLIEAWGLKLPAPAGLARFGARLATWPAVLIIAILCALAALIGAGIVMDHHPLSMDEYMATFDAAIFRHGRLMAPVPPEWRPFILALGPDFLVHAAGGAHWSSSYLPINAAIRAVFGALASPLLAVVALIATWGAGRRLWPERPGLALAATVLLATSAQFLFAAMTPYAMTAHVACNMVWLWLFLRGGKLGHAGALLVGFFACGLHQLVFHPLFVAPFILQALWERRWKVGAFYILGYAVICGFWVEYGSFALWWTGATAEAASPGVGAGYFTSQISMLIDDFDGGDAGLMWANLIRLATWQNILTLPLALMAIIPALRAGGPMRPLAGGVMLTTAVMFVIMPYQGHGWGYRYLHGFLGSIGLLAAFSLSRLPVPLFPPAGGKPAEGGKGDPHVGEAVISGRTAPPPSRVRGREVGVPPGGEEVGNFWPAFALATAFSVIVLLPVRAWQAHHFLHPYAAADAALGRMKGDVVIVDSRRIWFGPDLVRNAPDLTNRPIRLWRSALNPGQIATFCKRYSVSEFTASDAETFGIRVTSRNLASAPPSMASRKPPSTVCAPSVMPRAPSTAGKTE